MLANMSEHFVEADCESPFDGALLNELRFEAGALVSKDVIELGAPLLALPINECWTASAARECKEMCAIVFASCETATADLLENDSIWLALHLLYKRNLAGDAGEHCRKQLSLLPDVPEGLLIWSESDLSILQGSRWLAIAQQFRAEVEAEYQELVQLFGHTALAQIGVSSSSYAWAQSVVQQCSLRFLAWNGEPVDIFVPGLQILESGLADEIEKRAPKLLEATRLEFPRGEHEDPVLVFYAPREFAAGERVYIFHGGFSCANGRLLLERGKLLSPNLWNHVELAITLPIRPALIATMDHKLKQLELPYDLNPGQFLSSDAMEGWQPAQIVDGLMQLNIRIYEKELLPCNDLLELLQLATGDGSENGTTSRCQAFNVLQHALKSVQQGYAKVRQVDAVIGNNQLSRCARAACLVEREQQLLDMAVLAVDRAKDAHVERPAMPSPHEDGSVMRLRGCTVALQKLTMCFDSLPSNESQATRALQRKLGVLRACLASFPEGNPESVPTVPLVQTGNIALQAHGQATAAVLRCKLAACTWEARCLRQVLQCIESSDAGRMSSECTSTSQLLAGVLGEAATLQVRLLDFVGAHQNLTQCLELTPDSKQAVHLARECAQARVSRSAEVLDISDSRLWQAVHSVGGTLREMLTRNGYTQDGIVRAAGVPSILHMVSNKGEALERILYDRIQEGYASRNLVDLIRLFLLRRTMPLHQVVELLGIQVIRAFLLLRAFACLRGSSAEILSGEEAVIVAELASAGEPTTGHEIFSALALWPLEEDLVIATDFGDTQHAEGQFEPVMYLSLDSYALVAAAPRVEAQRVLDICCGSGVQGIVALRYYAEHVTFLDLNPRALRFTRFNTHLNGFEGRATFCEGSICSDSDLACIGDSPFQAILANPPFVPNPDSTASAAGPLYSGGGTDGELVHAAIITKSVVQLLAPGGRLSAVAEVPNPETLADRIKMWVAAEAADQKFTGSIFCGSAISAGDYWRGATQERSSLERRCYVEGLHRAGVQTMSEALVLLRVVSADRLVDGNLKVELEHEKLWLDDAYLRNVVALSLS